MAANPDLIPFMISEDNQLYGVDPAIQQAVYQYKADRSQLFPGIFEIQNGYYDSGKSKAYLNAHPELKAYWDWKKQQQAWHPEIVQYVSSTKNAPTATVDIATQIAAYPTLQGHMDTLTYGGSLSSGDMSTLRYIWEKSGYPFGSFTAWLEAAGLQ